MLPSLESANPGTSTAAPPGSRKTPANSASVNGFLNGGLVTLTTNSATSSRGTVPGEETRSTGDDCPAGAATAITSEIATTPFITHPDFPTFLREPRMLPNR